MFGLNGFNPVSLLATAAFGPAGGLVAQLATQVFASMGQQLLQMMGERLGLPQDVIDLAHDEFAASAGIQGGQGGGRAGLHAAIADAGERTGASPAEIGDAQRNSDKILLDTLRDASEGQDVKDARLSKGKAPGWLMAMAQALGAKLNELGDDMTHRAETMTKDDPKASAEFSVVSQQFSMLMNATSNAIKTVGEAMANTARKQ